jgi:hypothetical protein
MNFYEDPSMKRYWWLRGLKFAAFAVVAIGVLGAVVMGLWNWLLPDLFGWRAIGYWQALGLLVLSKILLGGFRGRGGHGMHWRARMWERWDQMSEEERERFREGMRKRCGPPAA